MFFREFPLYIRKHAMRQVNVVACLLVMLCFSCKKQDFKVYDDFLLAKTEALLRKKPMFIVFDFYGNPTLRTKKLLEDRAVQRALNAFVVLHVYCDDQTAYADGRTNGFKMPELQKKITGQVFQPMYCFVSTDEKLLASPLGYTDKRGLLKYISDFKRTIGTTNESH
jgi:hypothetical protein